MCKLKYIFSIFFCFCFCFCFADDICDDTFTDGKAHYNKGDYKSAQKCFEFVQDRCGDNYEAVTNWIEKCRKKLNTEYLPFIEPNETFVHCTARDTIVSIKVLSNIAWTIESLNDSIFFVVKRDDMIDIHVYANITFNSRESFFRIKSLNGKTDVVITLKQDARILSPQLSVDKEFISCSHNDTVIYLPVSSNVAWEIVKPVGDMYSVIKDDSTTLKIRIFANTTTSPRDDYFFVSATIGDKMKRVYLHQNTETLIFNIKDVNFKMVPVKGGELKYGDKIENTFILDNYYIGETEVTQALWTAVMESTIQEQRDKEDRDFRLFGVGDNYPMYYISWSEAKQLCDRLNNMLKDNLPKGYRFSLPNEAQWVFAALGGNKSLNYRYAGHNVVDSVAWFANNSYLSHPVGSKKCNELGLYDMSGNVAECVYRNKQSYKANSEMGWYSYCGGNWSSSEEHCRVLNIPSNFNYAPYMVGIRLVLSKVPNESSLTFNIGDINFNMIYVAGGVFNGKRECLIENTSISTKFSMPLDDYYIGETEVTQALWTAVMESTIQEQRDKVGKNLTLFGVGNSYPMYYISLLEANAMCEKLNELLSEQLPKGYKFILPTTYEWEFAARGGNVYRADDYSGNNRIDRVAWYNDNSGALVHFVGEKKSNELGLYDMSGNVAEWASNYICGGSWDNNLDECKISNYRFCEENIRSNSVGMRLLLKKNVIEGKTLNFNVDGVDLKMKFVEGGEFFMGDDTDKFSNNLSHRIILDDYYIGETEVTQALWKVLNEHNTNLTSEQIKKESYPVTNISWFDANVLCDKLNHVLGVYLPMNYKFLLPTEAQWEYAARGGIYSHNCKYSGGNNLGVIGWFDGNSADDKHSVALQLPNELGLYDMSGNVAEWCSDWYDKDYFLESIERNPKGPFHGNNRVLRGGSFIDDIVKCRNSYRAYSSPEKVSKYNGFRLSISRNVSPIKEEKRDPLLLNINNVQFKMIYIDGGTFYMGNTKNDEDVYDNELPRHEVFLDGFYIGEFEVTQDLWQAVMDTNPSLFKGEKKPVDNVSWEDCQVFIEKLNQLSGCVFSLPTEAQWEFAATKGNDFKYSGGDKIESVAYYYLNTKSTNVVGKKKPNEVGLYDMSGNVWEWCADWYALYTNLEKKNPKGPTIGKARVLRGGSWSDEERSCRVYSRKNAIISYKSNNVGLRLVLLDYCK